MHCIFIVIVTSLKNPVNGFSFAGLIVTEIVPSAFFLLLSYRLRSSKRSSGSSDTRTKGTHLHISTSAPVHSATDDFEMKSGRG
jgi:hypothetical protein